jgi:hypothetical protein
MPRVIVPFSLRKYFNHQREFLIHGNSLNETMDRLFRQFPEFKAMNDDSGLLSIYINNRLIKTGADNWDQLSLNQDDEIALVIPIAGG